MHYMVKKFRTLFPFSLKSYWENITKLGFKGLKKKNLNLNKMLVFVTRTDTSLKNQVEIVLIYIHFMAFCEGKQVATFVHEYAAVGFLRKKLTHI